MAIHSDAKTDGGCAEEKVARLEPLCDAAVVRASAATRLAVAVDGKR